MNLNDVFQYCAYNSRIGLRTSFHPGEWKTEGISDQGWRHFELRVSQINSLFR